MLPACCNSIEVKLRAFKLKSIPGAVASALVLSLFLPLSAQNDTNSRPNGDDIISFLNQTVVWYRQLAAQQQIASEPSDVLFLDDNRNVADQIVRLSFDFARQRAQVLGQNAKVGANRSAAVPSQYQRLADSAAKADQQVQETQKELESMQAQLAGEASAAKRKTLKDTINELQGELGLFQARRDAIRNMLQFATGAGAAGPENLQGQIDELARSTPAATTTGKEAGAQPTTNSSAASAAAVANRQKREEPSGIFGLITDLFQLRHKISALDDNLKLTDELVQAGKGLRQPLVSSIRTLTQSGDQVAAQADSADPAALVQERQQLDSLTQQFKEVSATLFPLGKQSILLDVYKRSTTNWRNGVKSEYDAEMKGLLLRLVGLAVILGVVLGIAEVWRRATFRYITDPRRRYQFLLLRRILLWIVIAIIIFIAFASEIGSVTTFAGLMTAGIAVALQNVILSVAGYFFLIGKYGVRVGDRVQVSGITGDVVDIGLVRLHLMEVSEGPGPRPTGRVVVFSNAVVFQANSGLFKQIPGTHFLWHEITLSLARQSNYRDVEKCLMDAVEKIFSEYREKLETQRQNMERALNSVAIREFAPESRLHLTQSGVELVIRYPVELETAAEIDDRITREVLSALESDPHLRAHISGGPEKAEEQPAEVKS